MLKIRLQRVGRKNDPSFRVVVTESQNGPKSGNFIEILGSYDARQGKPLLKGERINYWLSKGAQASETVHNMLVKFDIIKGATKNNLPKMKPVEKAEEAPVEAPKAEPAGDKEDKPESTETEKAEVVEKKEAEVVEEKAPAEEKPEETKPDEPKEEAKPAEATKEESEPEKTAEAPAEVPETEEVKA